MNGSRCCKSHLKEENFKDALNSLNPSFEDTIMTEKEVNNYLEMLQQEMKKKIDMLDKGMH